VGSPGNGWQVSDQLQINDEGTFSLRFCPNSVPIRSRYGVFKTTRQGLENQRSQARLPRHHQKLSDSTRLRALGKSPRLAVLEIVGFSISLMSGGRTRGVKPNRVAEAYPELQTLLRAYVKGGKTA